MPDPVTRATTIFHGAVQGVGFRFTTRRLVSHYPDLTGSVRNLPNGTVELITEGDKPSIKELHSEILSRFAGYITEHHIEWNSGPRVYRTFSIRF